MFEVQTMRLKRKEETNIVGSWTIYGGLSGICTRPPWQPPNSTQTLEAALPALAVCRSRGVFNCQSSKWLLAGVYIAQRTLSASQERFLTDKQAGLVAVYHSLGFKF